MLMEKLGIKSDYLDILEVRSSFLYFIGPEELSSIRGYNEVDNLEQVISIVRDIKKEYDSQYTEFYISKKSMKILDVKNIRGKKEFNCTENLNGWLVFIDCMKFANWAHPCQYLFIAKGDVFAEVEDIWPVNNMDLMEKVE